ncbi:MAG TPA: membrane protein insertase YidC [Bryobacteraceae bacterium]|nr:membrane protein insertase YidC [Bryobacteraceae bacterium]
MADNPIQPGKPGKRELTMEQRLLLAFLLMGLVLFVTPYIYKAPPPAKTTKPALPAATSQTTANAATATASQPAAATPAAPAAENVPGRIAADSEQSFVVDTDIYHVRFSNRGAVVQSWVLKKYRDRTGKPLELVNPASFSKIAGPFSLSLADAQAANSLNFGLYVPKPGADGLSIQYEFSDGKNYAKKSFEFSKNGYLTHVTTEVTQDGVPVAHSIQWRGGFGDATVLNRVGEEHAVYYDPHEGSFLSQGKLFTRDAKSVKDGPVVTTGDYSFAGLDDRFFAFVVLPKDNTSIKVETIKDDVPPAAAAKEESRVGVEIGGDSVNRFVAFVGPKDIDLLRKVDPKLQQLIDWGWFGVIAKPLFLGMHWLNDTIVHNYGWSIVLITVVINLLILPMRFSSMKSQKKMQALKPQLDTINAKYKGLSLRDPRKQKQNEEVMELYKKEGVNPMGGCLPMLVQLPLIYAFYKVLAVTIELRGAHWLWVTDLSQPEALPIHILPIIMIVTQFISQKMTPSPGMDASQAKIMQLMPLMFGFFFYNLSSGLVLYWLTSNLVGIVQQWFVNRMMPAPPPPPPKPVPKKKVRG